MDPSISIRVIMLTMQVKLDLVCEVKKITKMTTSKSSKDIDLDNFPIEL